MTFAPDTVEALESSVHLANSALAPDTLTTIEALQEFYVRFAYTTNEASIALGLDRIEIALREWRSV